MKSWIRLPGVSHKPATDIDGIERSILVPGEKSTHLFFCEPNRSDQKGSAERNHRLLRRIIAKGTSVQDFMQADMTLVSNHINSYVRKSIGNECPYDIASRVLPEDFFLHLGLENSPRNRSYYIQGFLV